MNGFGNEKVRERGWCNAVGGDWIWSSLLVVSFYSKLMTADTFRGRICKQDKEVVRASERARFGLKTLSQIPEREAISKYNEIRELLETMGDTEKTRENMITSAQLFLRRQEALCGVVYLYLRFSGTCQFLTLGLP